MIGMIVTGHGNFGTGLTSSVRLIGGEPEHYVPVDFLPTDSTESLQKKLLDAFETLKDCKDGILIMTDLVGGSPFKLSAELSITMKDKYNITVVSGTNLGMLLEANMSRNFMTDLQELADAAVEAGKTQVIKYTYEEKKEEESEEDGI